MRGWIRVRANANWRILGVEWLLTDFKGTRGWIGQAVRVHIYIMKNNFTCRQYRLVFFACDVYIVWWSVSNNFSIKAGFDVQKISQKIFGQVCYRVKNLYSFFLLYFLCQCTPLDFVWNLKKISSSFHSYIMDGRSIKKEQYNYILSQLTIHEQFETFFEMYLCPQNFWYP